MSKRSRISEQKMQATTGTHRPFNVISRDEFKTIGAYLDIFDVSKCAFVCSVFREMFAPPIGSPCLPGPTDLVPNFAELGLNEQTNKIANHLTFHPAEYNHTIEITVVVRSMRGLSILPRIVPQLTSLGWRGVVDVVFKSGFTAPHNIHGRRASESTPLILINDEFMKMFSKLVVIFAVTGISRVSTLALETVYPINLRYLGLSVEFDQIVISMDPRLITFVDDYDMGVFTSGYDLIEHGINCNIASRNTDCKHNLVDWHANCKNHPNHCDSPNFRKTRAVEIRKTNTWVIPPCLNMNEFKSIFDELLVTDVEFVPAPFMFEVLHPSEFEPKLIIAISYMAQFVYIDLRGGQSCVEFQFDHTTITELDINTPCHGELVVPTKILLREIREFGDHGYTKTIEYRYPDEASFDFVYAVMNQ